MGTRSPLPEAGPPAVGPAGHQHGCGPGGALPQGGDGDSGWAPGAHVLLPAGIPPIPPPVHWTHGLGVHRAAPVHGKGTLCSQLPQNPLLLD